MIAEVLKRRWWLLLLIPAIAIATAVVVTSVTPPHYVASSVVMVDYRRPVQGDTSGEIVPAGLQPNYINTLVSVISSYPSAQRAVQRLGLEQTEAWQARFAEWRSSGLVPNAAESSFTDWAASKLLENLTAIAGKRNNLIEISYRADNPTFAAQAANAFAAAFLQLIREYEINPALVSIETTDTIIGQLREKLELAQRRVSEYQQEAGIVATEERLDVETARLNELAQNRLRTEDAARVADSRMALLQAAPAGDNAFDGLPEVLNNDLVRNARIELSRKQSELADLSTTLGSSHPTYQRVSAEVASQARNLRTTINQIVAGVKIEVEQARQQAEAARVAEEAQRANILAMKTVRDGLQPLLREVENARANFGRAMEMSNQYAIFASLSQTNLSVVNDARPPVRPAGPNLKMNLALALIGGIFLSVSMVLLLEMFGGKVRSREQIEGAGELTVVSEIPKARAG